MARKKIEAKDVTLRIPLKTMDIVEEMADMEGIPPATWLGQVIASHVRHHVAAMTNAKAAALLDSMVEHMASAEAAGWDFAGGVSVAPPPRSKNGTKQEIKREKSRGARP